MATSWRTWTDRLKRSPFALRVADRLGRGCGRFRWIDSLSTPPPAPLKPDLSNWNQLSFAAAWIGHATVLLRMANLNILTDPVFSSRIGLGMGFFTIGPQRKIAAAITIDQLPPIDLILISHAHFDHLDRPTLARLPKRSQVITASRTGDLVNDLGFASVTELRWGESTQIGDLKITAHQVRHWGARTFYDQYRGYNAYILESPHHRVLYGGDSAYQEFFRTAGRVDLGIFSISAYNPYIQAHATPEQVWEMSQHLPAARLLPMHHGTFKLSHEPMEEPIARLLAAAGPEADKIVIRQVGGMWYEQNLNERQAAKPPRNHAKNQ